MKINEKILKKLVRSHLDSTFAKKNGLELRRYQIIAAMKSFDLFNKNQNVVINLPTGTGKTMVANITSLILFNIYPTCRCLYLAPTRSLAYQHRYYSNWLAPKYRSLLLIEAAKSISRLHTLALRSQIIISTPRLCANLIKSNALSRDIVNSFSMISIDEFDDHFVFEYQDNGPSARLDTNFASFYSNISKSIPVQLLSATDPKALLNLGNGDPEIKAYSNLMDEIYKPVEVKISKSLYKKHIPTARISHIKVNDINVFYFGWALSVELALCFDRIFDETGFLLSRREVITKLNSILKNNISKIALMNHKFVPLNVIDKKHFLFIRHILNCHEHLYEDMFYGFSYEVRPTRIFSIKLGKYIVINLPRLIDERKKNEFHSFLRNKSNVLIDILNINKNKSCVIFSRKIRLSDAIYKETVNNGWNAIKIDSRFNDEEKNKRLLDFQNRKYNLLLITRKTGGRGLDLPQADFSIFYNPKSRETTTWQELSRIRSNVHKTKTSFFLTYSHTADTRRMNDLLIKMRLSGRDYQFSRKKTYGLHFSLEDYEDFIENSRIPENKI